MSMSDAIDELFPELKEDDPKSHCIRVLRLTIDGDVGTHNNVDIDKNAPVVPGFLPFRFTEEAFTTYISFAKIEQMEVADEDAQDLAEVVAENMGEIIGVIKEYNEFH